MKIQMIQSFCSQPGPVSGNFFWGGASFYLPSTFWQYYIALMQSEYFNVVNI